MKSALMNSRCLSLLAVLPLAAALTACGSNTGSSDAPVIRTFTATPTSVPLGVPTTLAWEVSGATTLTINNGVGVVTGLTEKAVTPAADTIYTLTAEGAGGKSSKSVSVTVTAAQPPPIISSFSASPPSIGVGGSATLSWTVTNATALSIDQGVGVVTGTTSVSVSPTANTTYTLLATGTGGSISAQATVSVGAAGLRLDYQDPSTTGKKIALLRNPGSTNTRLLLDVKVIASGLTGFGVAINLPLDHTKATFNGNLTSANPGIIIPGDGPIFPGLGAGMAMGGKASATGPLADFLTVGVARKKSSVGDTDVSLPQNKVLFQIALDVVQTPDPANGNLFDGTALPAKAKLGLLMKDGSSAAATSDFAVGKLFITH